MRTIDEDEGPAAMPGELVPGERVPADPESLDDWAGVGGAVAA